jgi:hypothetical protein
MLAPLASGNAVGLAGVQATVAPAGSPGMVQVALSAALAPLFLQVIEPLTV